MGTYGSRSLAVGGSAIVKATDKIIAKGKKIAAHLMEADVADIVFEQGTFKVAGTDKAVPLGAAVFAAYVPHNYPLEELEPGMDENAFYDPSNFVYPSGTQICEVEIDPDTGVVEVVNHTAVDDFGNIINPMIVDGQVHGGIAQGIGQALMENAVYDKETGQLVSGSFMDYTMPRADDVPSFKLGNKVTPCPHNPLGVKGCGEAGAIAAPAAVMNAVHDALAPLGVTHVPMPATPLNVWQAIQRGGELKMYDFAYHRPKSLAEAVGRAQGQARGPRHVGRHDPDPDPEAAAGQAERRGRPQRHQGTGRHQGRGQRRHHRRHDPPCRRRQLRRREGRDPGAGLSRRPHRRPAGPQPRHDGRLGGEQRSGGRLSGGGRRRSTRPSPPTAARSRPTTSSRACSRPRSRTAS